MPVARSSLTRSNVIGADDAGHIAVDTNAEVHLDEWIAPEAVDDNGLLRGGRILEWMDVGGALAASRFCRRACVTASVNGVDIYRPIEVGEHVSMSARVAHTSRRSIGVHVTLRARGGKLLSDSEVLAAYMTFVPGDMQQGGEVNGWTPLTPRDRVLAREGDLRREFRQLLTSGAYLEADGGEAPAPERASLRTLARDVRRIVPFLESEPASGPARSPEASYVHRIEPVFAGSMNMHGTLYGGTLMRWIEDAAGLSARAFTDTAMVAQGVHGLDFLKPVSCHTFLHTHAMAVRADNRSVTVLVEVTSEDPTSGTAQQSLRGFFTYRPLDRRAVVPALVVHSHAERALWAESAQHIAFSRRLREQ